MAVKYTGQMVVFLTKEKLAGFRGAGIVGATAYCRRGGQLTAAGA
jgi:hypothetical protein